MTFDVTKFLALTAVLAGASIGAAACSSNSNDDAETNGGSSGSSGSSSGSNAGGDDNNVGGSSAHAGDSSSAPGGEGGVAGGSGGADAGGAAMGGAATGGAGAGAGGEGGAQQCYTTDAAYEDDPCADILDTVCDGAAENFSNPFYDLCTASWGAKSALRISYVECVEGDVCAETAAASAAACWSTLAAQACAVEGAAALCTTIVGTCSTGLDAATCKNMIDTTAMIDVDFVPECMDPNGESYNEFFEGDCKARLAACSGVPAL